MKNNKPCGFTLIEMSIVLIVISLILAGVLKTVGVQRQQLKRDETRQQLETIREALIGFALTSGRLPCPDTGIDGLEDFNGGASGPPPQDCLNDEGWVPHVDIGVGNRDAWGSRFRYRVTGTNDAPINSFTDDPIAPAISSFSVADVGDITVNDEAGNSIALGIPAIVISYGENARATPVGCTTGLSASEIENCDNETTSTNSTFISSFYSNVTNQEFDDLVIWIPLTILKARMIEAALLP
ncbi:MAG: type II secretion system GspH family protein [Gammaproteobacteria bacterium]|nr:type II secretion system GspH family protein [Gammaproteobacteria bacterium]